MINKLIFLDEVDSTNSYLRLHCRELPDGAAVTAERQTAGRGRHGHSWEDIGGGMLPMSVLLVDPPDRETLTARVGLAVCGALEKACGGIKVRTAIKWPNDIIMADRKVCGILCESVCSGDRVYVICGIGINISQSEEQFLAEGLPHAGSLKMLTGVEPDRRRLFEDVAEAVKIRAAMPFSDCYDEFKARLINLGRTVKIIGADGERTAVAEDVAPNGFLICRDEGGLFEVGSGEVSVRGVNGYI
ncbi:MAG: biotin--[acetyl-CoA-carboxylase] ligase [Oscillospiraceae bacterium]|nr:biotin--[acetyl-CoA-carboxylase] ligase [Oscillospiraceae bacterium]